MLTIIGPVKETSWSMIRCRCDCGAYLNLPYQRVYYRQFSCGCTRRTRSKVAPYNDYTGVEIYNSMGNERRGRTLTVLYRDPETQQWAYACSCCAEVSLMPHGMERGIRSSLKELAGQVCPFYVERYTNNKISADYKEKYGFLPYSPKLRTEYEPYRRRGLGIGTFEQDAQYWLDQGRLERKNVRFDAGGKICAVYGLPKLDPADKDKADRRVQLAGWVIWSNAKRLAEQKGLSFQNWKGLSWQELQDLTEEEIYELEQFIEAHRGDPDITAANRRAAANELEAEIEAALDAPVPEWLR